MSGNTHTHTHTHTHVLAVTHSHFLLPLTLSLSRTHTHSPSISDVTMPNAELQLSVWDPKSRSECSWFDSITVIVCLEYWGLVWVDGRARGTERERERERECVCVCECVCDLRLPSQHAPAPPHHTLCVRHNKLGFVCFACSHTRSFLICVRWNRVAFLGQVKIRIVRVGRVCG
jgi:hypothetical protein